MSTIWHGGGSSRYIENIARKYKVLDNVKILGSLPHDKVFELIDNIDIYIQPSLQEGLPRSVIEAMSRACPVIGSKTGGIPELINEEYIFNKKNIKEIEKLIENVGRNKEKLKSASKENFIKSKEFEKDKLRKKRENFYKEILGDMQ